MTRAAHIPDLSEHDFAEEVAQGNAKPIRFPLVTFDSIQLDTSRDYLVKGWLPRTGLACVWGPSGCGKTFFVTDILLHVALGRAWRGMRVQAGPVVYVAVEDARGIERRAYAFQAYRMAEDHEPVPFYIVNAASIDMVRDHAELVDNIRRQVTGEVPVVVAVDTLNRSLAGSESRDEDMSAYINAASAISEAFGCCTLLIHHCGVEGTRPRGHTSLTAAVDAQIAVSKGGERARAVLEKMKNGPDGAELAFRLMQVELGEDCDGDPITSCIVEPVEAAPASRPSLKLTPNQKTMLSLLEDTMPTGMTTAEWTEAGRDVGMNLAKQRFYDIRKALKDKRLVHEYADRWHTSANE